MQMSLGMSMRLIFGDDWKDVPCKYLAMMLFLWNRGLWIFLYIYTRATVDVFPVVANTQTKSIQKLVKSIDVDKLESKNI